MTKDAIPFDAEEKEKKSRWHLALCFAVPTLILFVIYLFMQVYPFGENSVLVLDLNGQYVYFFEHLRRIVTEGGSFLYSFGRALGGEFMGIYAYYLASPLSYLVVLFPKENITEALLLIILLKCGLCGLTFGIYADTVCKTGKTQCVIFSTTYALSAFCVVMQHNLMWTDCIILLPIIMIGIRKMISKGSMTLYVISLGAAVLSNFYIGYMTCIFSAIYFFYAYFSMTDAERNPNLVRAHFAKSSLRMFLSSLTAAAIAAVIIIPTLYSLSLGKSTFSDPSFEFTQKFDFADGLTKLYFGSYDTVRPEGLPFLFTSTLTLLTAPLYFISKKIPLREKISSAVLMLLFAASMNGSTIDIFWHGMQKPNWLNYRYAFMLVFFFVVFSSKALDDIRNIGFKPVILCAAVSVLVLFFLQKQDYDNLPDLACVWASVGFIAVYLIILKFMCADKSHIRETALSVLAIVVCFELFASGLYNFYALDNDVSFSSRTGYRNYVDKMQVAVDEIKSLDNGFYRTEITEHRKTNDNMALGTYGLSGSTSTLNAETIKFLNRMGFASKSHWSKYLGQTPITDSLLDVKYIIYQTDEDKPSLYESISVNEDAGTETLKNPYALSVAFGVSSNCLSCPFTDDTAIPSPLDKTDLLVGYMIGNETDAGIFDDITEVSSYTENLSEKSTADHVKYEKIREDDDAFVSFVFESPNDGAVYCYFPSSYTIECNLYVNGTKIGTYFGNETYRTVYLGTFEKGDGINVRLELKKDELYLKDGCGFFKIFNEDNFVKSFDILKECQLEVTSHEDGKIEGTVNVVEGRETIFTSIAYDKGWKVYCDGEEIEISKALDALITFTLPEGEHTITMKYEPNEVFIGILVTICGLAAFTVITVLNRLLIEKANKNRRIESLLTDVGVDTVCFDKVSDERGFGFNTDALKSNESRSEEITAQYEEDVDEDAAPQDGESAAKDGSSGTEDDFDWAQAVIDSRILSTEIAKKIRKKQLGTSTQSEAETDIQSGTETNAQNGASAEEKNEDASTDGTAE